MYWLYIWLGITVFTAVIEFITMDLVSIWFVPSGIVCMILAACNVPFYIQIPVFICLSLVLILSLRKIFMKMLKKGDEKTNTDRFIGKELKLLTKIEFGIPGTVKIDGVVWNVVLEDDKKELEVDSLVRVLKITGNKLIVEEIL